MKSWWCYHFDGTWNPVYATEEEVMRWSDPGTTPYGPFSTQQEMAANSPFGCGGPGLPPPQGPNSPIC